MFVKGAGWKLGSRTRDMGVQCDESEQLSVQLDLGGQVLTTGREKGPVVTLAALCSILQERKERALEL